MRTGAHLNGVEVRPADSSGLGIHHDLGRHLKLERDRYATVAFELFETLPISPASREWLRFRYLDPRLPYHNASHIGALWARHLAHGGTPTDLGIGLAITFHDAVFEPGATDNEVRSAAKLQDAASGSPALAWAIHAVLATADHFGYSGDDPGVLRLLDLDLTSLGAEPEAFAQNNIYLRAEEPDLTEDEWRCKQLRFFDAARRRRPLFRTGLGAHYEQAAQRNIAAVLRQLRPD